MSLFRLDPYSVYNISLNAITVAGNGTPVTKNKRTLEAGMNTVHLLKGFCIYRYSVEPLSSEPLLSGPPPTARYLLIKFQNIPNTITIK